MSFRRFVALVAPVAVVAGLVDSNYLWDMVSLGPLTAFIVVSVAVPVMRWRRQQGVCALACARGAAWAPDWRFRSARAGRARCCAR